MKHYLLFAVLLTGLALAAPPAVVTPTVTVSGADAVITWTKPAGTFDSFRLYRRAQAAPGPLTLIGSPIPSATSWVDAGAAAGGYYYALDTVAAGVEGAMSPVASASPAPVQTQTTTATLTWVPPTLYTDGSAIADGALTAFNIYQGGAKVASVGPTVTTWVTGQLVPGTYTFSVTAVAGTQESGQSASVSASVTAPVKVPQAPASVTIKVNQ